MVLTVTKRRDKVMFGPVEDWGKKSILVKRGQYTLQEYNKRVFFFFFFLESNNPIFT